MDYIVKGGWRGYNTSRIREVELIPASDDSQWLTDQFTTIRMPQHAY
jgi:hypothetical protein